MFFLNLLNTFSIKSYLFSLDDHGYFEGGLQVRTPRLEGLQTLSFEPLQNFPDPHEDPPRISTCHVRLIDRPPFFRQCLKVSDLLFLFVVVVFEFC